MRGRGSGVKGGGERVRKTWMRQLACHLDALLLIGLVKFLFPEMTWREFALWGMLLANVFLAQRDE